MISINQPQATSCQNNKAVWASASGKPWNLSDDEESICMDDKKDPEYTFYTLQGIILEVLPFHDMYRR